MTSPDRPSEQLRALADALVRADNPLTPTSTIHRRVRAIASAVADLEGERDRLREEARFSASLEADGEWQSLGATIAVDNRTHLQVGVRRMTASDAETTP